MNILEIKLENPIGLDEVIRLRSVLISSNKQDYLIIDTGVHDFRSIKVMKYLKDQLSDLEPCLTKFKRIAFLHPPKYRNESGNPKHYNYFSSREEAINWFSDWVGGRR